MAIVGKQFDLKGFKSAVQKGVFLPGQLSYGYVDETRFEDYQKRQEWKTSKITDTFNELQQRLSARYYKNVVLAQTCALDYATLQFPAYSLLVTEDLSEDWLAIVDFHKKHSRDHSLHQPLTAYIAASLLGFGVSDDSLAIPVDPGNLLDYCVNTILTSKEAEYILQFARSFGLPEIVLNSSVLARQFWKDLFYRAVVLAALFHDIGYPWQYVDRIGIALKKNVGILHPIDTTVSSIVNHFKDRMVMLPLRYYRTDHVNEPINIENELSMIIASALKTHGFPGAIAFLSLNDAIRKYPSNHPLALLQEFTIEWAAMGIFMHDMAGLHKKCYPKLRVRISQDPLSAIISLADYLEEFDRPKVRFQPKSRQCHMRYYSDCTRVEIETDSISTLTIQMKYKGSASKAIASAIKNEETDDYFDSSNGYIDLSPIGIRKVVYKQV